MAMEALHPVVEALVALFLVVGGSFALIGSWGLARLPDFFTRLHGPSKASTLGVGGMLIASMICFSALRGSPSLRELLITLFLFVTAPVSAHLLAKAALHRGLPGVGDSRRAPGAAPPAATSGRAPAP